MHRKTLLSALAPVFSFLTLLTLAAAAGVRLDPMPASETGRTMEISDGNNTPEFTDVVVGEVWLLSGQSNMAMRTPTSLKS
jgi:hypothetical protein